MQKAMESDLWFPPRPAWGSVKMSLLVKSHILSPHGPACLVLLSPVGLRNSQKGEKMRGWTSDAKQKAEPQLFHYPRPKPLPSRYRCEIETMLT